jgi:ribosomal protein L35AE/L33A
MIIASLLLAGSAGWAQDRVRLDGSAADPRVAPPGTKAIVWLFTASDCPISNRYAPEVARLAGQFGPEGVVFDLIYPNPRETPASIREHMSAFAYADATKAFHDPDHVLVKIAGVSVTPEAAVFAAGRVVYRGRIDDRYVDFGRDRPAPTVHDLEDAVRAVASGQAVRVAVTPAVGCFIADFTR